MKQKINKCDRNTRLWDEMKGLGWRWKCPQNLQCDWDGMEMKLGGNGITCECKWINDKIFRWNGN